MLQSILLLSFVLLAACSPVIEVTSTSTAVPEPTPTIDNTKACRQVREAKLAVDQIPTGEISQQAIYAVFPYDPNESRQNRVAVLLSDI